MQCPKCGSTEIELRDHEKNLKKIGGILMTSAGATAGTVGGAASGASIGAAIASQVLRGNCRRHGGNLRRRNQRRHYWGRGRKLLR